jgi:hypothetical protein
LSGRPIQGPGSIRAMVHSSKRWRVDRTGPEESSTGACIAEEEDNNDGSATCLGQRCRVGA